MSGITTHVLDTAAGRPAAKVSVVLDVQSGNAWHSIGAGETDSDGRLRTLWPADRTLVAGVYRLVFDTGRYFASLGVITLYPSIVVVFEAQPGESHYHVPLLLSPFGYSTYRGS